MNNEGVEHTIEHYCSASIGVVLFKGATPGKEEIIKIADDMMYQAKSAGRNKVMFYAWHTLYLKFHELISSAVF